MGKYYVKFGLSKNFNAGSKAMKDIMALLESKGYRAVFALPSGTTKFLKLIDIPLLFFTLLFKVGSKGTMIYFVPSNMLRIRFLKFCKGILGFRLICFINDIESMRMNKSKEYAIEEMKSIAVADVVLVPNENSIRILQEKYKMANSMVPVGVWDYLDNNCFSFKDTVCDLKEVAFAGNLSKSPFINDLHLVDLTFKIWGSGKEKGNDRNVDFRGADSPDNLIGHIAACSWGLVWDGESINTCTGLLGTYLRFNNSHKCGLYLAAGIPLIVWRESGMAQFVSKYQVGICVSSLCEAADIIHRMDAHTYSDYRKNAQRVGMQVRRGDFFLRALAEAENLEI
jgi:hypothetical protein